MPTVEHYLPLLVLLGMHSGQKNGVIELLWSGFQHGSISMASFSMQCT
jgi:aromatic ring-opening dioxygenase catalytic subunit (LigB family)